jgi:hypothetical protein
VEKVIYIGGEIIGGNSLHALFLTSMDNQNDIHEQF